jgi:hypothetical protein
LTYKEVDAVLSGHLDTKLDGADVNQIQILHVSIHFICFACSMLIHLRLWHRNGASSVLAQTERRLHH